MVECSRFENVLCYHYRRYAVTTAPSLGRLLISHITLRGPDLHQVYALVATHPHISYPDLVTALTPDCTTGDPFDLGEASLAEALNFLLVAGVVEQEGPARRQATFRTTPLPHEVSFPLLLLHHIQAHHDQRQQAPALIYRQLVAEDALALTIPQVRDQMERGPLRTLFAWTGEKVTFWSHLAHYLGLIRRIDRSAEALIVPRPDLVLAACHWAMRENPTTPHAISVVFDTIDHALFACYTMRGRVHRGLAQTLTMLERGGHVQITHSADASRSLLLGDRRVSEVQLLLRGGKA